MTPPENATVHEWPGSVFWFDEEGILCSIQRNAPQQTLDEAKLQLAAFVEITGGKKVCVLTDSTNGNPVQSKEMRDYAAEVLPDIIKAIAIVSRSALGKMVANLFFAIKSQPYPIKFFNTEQEAKQWLKQYL